MSITRESVPSWRPIRPDPRAPLDSWRREPVPGDCRAQGRGQSENGLDKSSLKYILQVNMEETYLRRDMPWKTYWQCRSATSLQLIFEHKVFSALISIFIPLHTPHVDWCACWMYICKMCFLSWLSTPGTTRAHNIKYRGFLAYREKSSSRNF